MEKDLTKDWDHLYKNMSILLEPQFPLYLTGKVAILKKAGMEEVHFLLNKVGLDRSSNKKIKEYSFGMKQRLGLAAALIGRPNILILDESIVFTLLRFIKGTDSFNPLIINNIHTLESMPKSILLDCIYILILGTIFFLAVHKKDF